MNNEIGRKLTSLTLMTIMLAGGMVIAAPSMVPEAAAAGQLYVSAENAQFGNLFGGAQIIEVIVRDPNRADTEVAEAEPTVRVDNNLLRMAQGSDGYWYAYLGSDTEVTAANVADNNLDYGVTYLAGTTSAGTQEDKIGQDHNGADGAGNDGLTDEAVSIFLSIPASMGVISNPPTLSDYNGTNNLGTTAADKQLNGDQSSTVGQIGLNATEWPFIQTFDFTQGAFDIILEQPGADEVVTLDYASADLDDYASIELDRSSASQGSEVFLTIVDNQLNIDPTNEDIVVFYVPVAGTAGTVSFTNGTQPSASLAVPPTGSGSTFTYKAYDNYFSDNGNLMINYDAASIGTPVFTNHATADDLTADQYLVFYESADNSGVFGNGDDASAAALHVNTAAIRGTTATIDYNDSAQSFLVANEFATLDMDESTLGDVWNSGETLTVTITDQDLNLNSASNEDITVSASDLVPSLQIGSPIMLNADATIEAAATTILSFNNMATVTATTSAATTTGYLEINTGTTVADLRTAAALADFTFLNYDIASVVSTTASAVGIHAATTHPDAALTKFAVATGTFASDSTNRGLMQITMATAGTLIIEAENVMVNFTATEHVTAADRFYIDFFTFGDKVNNAIYRMEVEESGDDTAVFEGDVEYIMLNQLNVDHAATFAGITPTGSSIVMIVHEDMTDEDSPRINYLDLGADGVSTQIADQQAAPSHSGVVTFDSANYKTADTVVVTLDDQDLNTDSGLIDVYVTRSDDKVGNYGESGAAGSDHIMDITFDDTLWTGLSDQTFTLVESDVDSGIFIGSFQIPSGQTGKDIEVNYNDHRDASGETIEVGAGAAVNANTGSVSFDRTVYPVPWGNASSDTRFAEHSNAANTQGASSSTSNALATGDVTVHVRITDADYDVSAVGQDTIADTTVTLKIERGSNSTTIAIVGNSGTPITEVSPDSGVFEYDHAVNFTAGPTNTCPTTFDTKSSNNGCVLQGDIITVSYVDNSDASGTSQTVTDSATFDLRNGVLQADKSVYLIGSDMILTLIEPDFDRDNDGAESYTLDLISWDSDAATTSMGSQGLSGANTAFDPEPSKLRETGDSTGIFQVVIEIPDTLNSEKLDRGEKIDLEYTDWGPAGADYVGQEDEDIGLTVYTSNFGATIELDQKVYTWTDTVYITIVAPDHNFDSGLVDEIGNSSTDPIKISTRGNELTQYKLVESGADTGIFIGEVTLGGFVHDADGDGTNDITAISGGSSGTGPTGGSLATTDNDGLTVSFEFSEDDTVVGSALIRWNIGEVQWLEASYPASGTGVVRIIDADMNLNPSAIDNFAVDAWSDSDAGGIDLTVTETNSATGIFEGTVFFTTVNDSSGHRLRVAEGDTVTAEYEDNTLPDPYTTADELDITSTTLIGTVVPPLERAPAANLRTVDAFGNSLNSVGVDQQVQLTADLANGQDKDQAFAYLVQIQDGDGVTVSLAWITGSLSSGQSFSPALSWIPTESGSYTATAFVWESVDNPTALSPPVSTTITVQ